MHLESTPNRERFRLSEKDRAAIEMAVEELKEQGYEFDLQMTPNEVLITHMVDGNKRTTHLTMVSDFEGAYDLLVKATVIHPNEKLPAENPGNSSGPGDRGNTKDHLRTFLEKLLAM